MARRWAKQVQVSFTCGGGDDLDTPAAACRLSWFSGGGAGGNYQADEGHNYGHEYSLFQAVVLSHDAC